MAARVLLLLPLALAACSTRGTYVSSGEVPIVVWLLPGADGPGPAYARPHLEARVDLYGPVGVVDDNVVYLYRRPSDRAPDEKPQAGDWNAANAVVFEPTGERIQTRDGIWEGYRRVESERAGPIIAELDARQ